MGINVTVDTIPSLGAATALTKTNANFAKLADEFDKVVYKDGREELTSNLDANSNKIINLPAPTSATEPVRLSDLENYVVAQALAGSIVVSTDGSFGANSNSLIPSQKAAKTYTDSRVSNPGYIVVDPGNIFNVGMIPAGSSIRAPVFVLNNPSPANLVAGYSSGIYIHIGNNPTATPAAGDTVAQTITVNNLNGRTHLWGSNTVVLQDASGADGITRSAEFEINNVKGFNPDPFSGTAPYRKNCIEIVGHSSSLYKLTAAATIWVNDTTGTGWFDQGLVLSRVASKGIRFIRNPGGASDTGVAFATAAISDESNSNATLAISGTHGSIIDLSGSPTFSQFILGKPSSDTSLNVKNNSNFGVTLSLDSGTSAAQLSALDLSDRGSVKWRLAKNNGNGFFIISDPLGTPVSVAEFAAGGGGSLGIGGVSPTTGLDVNTDKIRVRSSKTPATAFAVGNAGDICWDSNYVYVCVAPNTWKRSALSTW